MKIALCAAALPLGLAAGAAAEVTISLGKDGRSFIAKGVDSSAEFSVRVEGGEDLPAMAGEVTAIDAGLRFTPLFPLTPGMCYRANVGDVSQEFTIPAPDKTPVAEVAAIYPSGDLLPENLLKFYIHFTKPMAIGEAAQHVRLIGGDGEPVPLPFLELAEELWDPEGTRLTLFFDPGRVKRGLRPHEEEGRPLEGGKHYALEIDPAWRDAKGRRMAEGFSKRFRASEADYGQPDAAKWDIKAPAAGTREPVKIKFAEPLDHGLLERLLVVYDSGGQRQLGTATVVGGEKEWRWKPDAAWAPGSYRVVVETILEDRAGNSVARLFEEVGGRKEAWNVRGERFIRVPFEVEPGVAVASILIGGSTSHGIIEESTCRVITDPAKIHKILTGINAGGDQAIDVALLRPGRFAIFRDATGEPLRAYAVYDLTSPRHGLLEAVVKRKSPGRLKFVDFSRAFDGPVVAADIFELLGEEE